MAGGDGTVALAAGAAVEAGVPLAVFPGGTFNHFAKDIGCDSVAKTVRPFARARCPVSTWSVSTRPTLVINTASIGAYPRFVQTREKLEHKIGKPLAGIYAMFHTLRRDASRYESPTTTRPFRPSLFFLGNSTYLPSGFAPSRRTRMDDGLMDIRILETGSGSHGRAS